MVSLGSSRSVCGGNPPIFGGRGRFWRGVALGWALGAVSVAVSSVLASVHTPSAADPLLHDSLAPAAAVLPVFTLDATTCDLSRALADAIAASPDTTIRFRVHLVRVVDGDTIRIRWHGDEYNVRLLGIDTPEQKQPGFREAADALASMLADADAIHLTFPANHPRRDNFGRLLATVWADAINCNEALLESGHAKPYTRPRRARAPRLATPTVEPPRRSAPLNSVHDGLMPEKEYTSRFVRVILVGDGGIESTIRLLGRIPHASHSSRLIGVGGAWRARARMER